MKRRLAVSLACAAIAALALSRLRPQLQALESDERRNPLHVAAGEALLHGLSPLESGREREQVAKVMPFGGLMEALLVDHCPDALRPAALGALVLLQLGLVYALTALLSSPAAGLATAAVYAWSGWGDYTANGSVQFFYALLVSLVGLALARLARKPTADAHLAAGLAIGCSLLGRSPLAFLPPALLLVLALRREKLDPRRAALLCVVPYLFLIPWTAMNWSLQRKFVPFEYQEADRKIVGAVLGQIDSGEAFERDKVPHPPEYSRTGAVLLWAARRIAADPLAYLTGYAKRLALVFRWHGLPLVLAILAAWRFRRDARFRAVGFLGLYFLLIYCTITVHSTYFQPLLPLAAALAGAGACRLARLPEREGPAAELWFRGGLAGALAVSALALFLASAYGWAGPGPDGPDEADRAARGFPADPWLLSRRGKTRLAAGDIDGALKDFTRAVELRPDDPLRRFELATTAYTDGDSGPILGIEDAEEEGLELDLLKVMAWRRSGEPELAKRRWDETAGRTPESRLLPMIVRVVTMYEPARDRALAARRFVRLLRGSRLPTARARADHAILLHFAEQNDEAVAELERALALAPDLQVAYVTLAAVYTEMGRHDKAADAYRRGLKLTAGGDEAFLEMMRTGELESDGAFKQIPLPRDEKGLRPRRADLDPDGRASSPE
jgi:tetratricopeptide (TPR) repeat protein